MSEDLLRSLDDLRDVTFRAKDEAAKTQTLGVTTRVDMHVAYNRFCLALFEADHPSERKAH